MNRKKGVAYCGLACCLCEHTADCPGCRNEGCTKKEWCKSFNCCQKNGFEGCWECEEFPCDNAMLHKPKIRAFAELIAELGEEEFMNLLERNERQGIIYHYEGQILGDYDTPQTVEGVKKLLLNGKQQ